MKNRTKQFALRVVRVVQSLPERNRTAEIIGGQLLRAGTSVGANYRAACRAKSTADFINKMGTVEEEADERFELLGDKKRPGGNVVAKRLGEEAEAGGELLRLDVY